MKSASQTKNLVILYQKLFNKGLKKLKSGMSEKKKQFEHINIRKCSSINSFHIILIQNPKLKKVMQQLLDSGYLLQNLMRWKGQYCNLAIALKYFNSLSNVIKNTQVPSTNWTAMRQLTQEVIPNIIPDQQFFSHQDQIIQKQEYEKSVVSISSTHAQTIEPNCFLQEFNAPFSRVGDLIFLENSIKPPSFQIIETCQNVDYPLEKKTSIRSVETTDLNQFTFDDYFSF